MRELYQQLIIDHGRNPRHFGQLQNATHIKDGFNPLCGDKVTVYLSIENSRIKEVNFSGSGCAISMASASLMTEALIGQTVLYAEKLFAEFHALLTTGSAQTDMDLGKLSVLAGVAQYPARVKCATLSWHTMSAALHQIEKPVSTE